MNDTRQQWAYRSAGLQALIENQRAQHNSRKGSNTATAAWSKVLGERTAALHERNNSVFLETVLPHTRKEIVFHRRQFFLYQLHSIISEKRLLRNTFGIEGVFLAMFDDVSMSLASANRHKRKYV